MYDIIIVGAGACGLMAARKLSEAGKKVLILEARDRIGGRIYPLRKEEFGYEAMGGGEFVHGEAAVTNELIKEIGLTLEHGTEWWSVADGEPKVNEWVSQSNPLLEKKLKELQQDMTLVDFFDNYLPGAEHAALRQNTFRRVMGYDAADPKDASAFALRDELLSNTGSKQHTLKEGYGPMLRFLQEKCIANGAQIVLNKPVAAIDVTGEVAKVTCKDGSVCEAGKVICTVPPTVLKDIAFTPAIPEKLAAAQNIGFGAVIKILLNFKTKWWASAEMEANFEKMFFMFSNETIPTWWTQYPEPYLTLTGWLAGPAALDMSTNSDEQILELALTSLSNIFKISIEELKEQLVASKVVNWPKDPYAKGAYSYLTPKSEEAIEELLKPVAYKLYFAGEALYQGQENGCVEAALSVGVDIAKEILTNQ